MPDSPHTSWTPFKRKTRDEIVQAAVNKLRAHFAARAKDQTDD